MTSSVYYCPECKTEHRVPGRCKKCGGEFVKMCPGCAKPPEKCSCDTMTKCPE